MARYLTKRRHFHGSITEHDYYFLVIGFLKASCLANGAQHNWDVMHIQMHCESVSRRGVATCTHISWFSLGMGIVNNDAIQHSYIFMMHQRRIDTPSPPYIPQSCTRRPELKRSGGFIEMGNDWKRNGVLVQDKYGVTLYDYYGVFYI